MKKKLNERFFQTTMQKKQAEFIAKQMRMEEEQVRMLQSGNFHSGPFMGIQGGSMKNEMQHPR